MKWNWSFHHPRLFLNAEEIAEIKNRLNREPWAKAFDRLMDSASVAMDRKADPVEGEYPVDPTSSPQPAARSQLLRDCHAVRDMGLAYALTGEERFPRKIAHYILSWVEALTPRFPFESSVGDLCVAISAMYYGVDLVWRSRGFTDEDKYRLAMWADELACDLELKPIAFLDRPAGWVSVFYAASALAIEDPKWFDLAFDGFGPLIADRISSEGLMEYEKIGEDGLRASLFTLKSLTFIAVIARQQGIDFFNAEHRGRNLHIAFRRFVPFILDEETWHGSDESVGGLHSELYEIAYRVWGDPRFAQVLRRRGRNAFDGCILGPVLLTHGVELGD